MNMELSFSAVFENKTVLGVQDARHWPIQAQISLFGQLPQEPPQPFEPQLLPAQFGVQTH
jgi:hypothetical protein